MDPCPFVRILIGNLALKIPVASKPARSGVHPSSSPCFWKPCLKISIYTGRRGTTCGINSERILGKVPVPLDLSCVETRSSVFQNGWVSVGKDNKGANSTQMHLNVRAEPDPRFVFQFDGEPECSPQVFQIQGNIRQPVFTCKFSFRNSGDRNIISRSVWIFFSFLFCCNFILAQFFCVLGFLYFSV